MNKEYLDAVDTVCGSCHYCEEKFCETCPVRKTVDRMKRNELYISNAHIYFKSTSNSAEATYNQLQEICLQNGIDLRLAGKVVLTDNDGNSIDEYVY